MSSKEKNFSMEDCFRFLIEIVVEGGLRHVLLSAQWLIPLVGNKFRLDNYDSLGKKFG